jgi:hypothetical protein
MLALPYLSRVTKFFASHSNCDKLTGFSLVLWLLIAPNIAELHLEKIPTDLKLKLAIELDQLARTDGSVSAVFSRLTDVWIFSPDGKIDEPKKMDIFFHFLEIFRDTNIHPL